MRKTGVVQSLDRTTSKKGNTVKKTKATNTGTNSGSTVLDVLKGIRTVLDDILDNVKGVSKKTVKTANTTSQGAKSVTGGKTASSALDAVSGTMLANSLGEIDKLTSSMHTNMLTAPKLQNVSNNKNEMASMLESFKNFMQSNKDNQNVVMPIYIGGDKLDDVILNRQNRKTIRSGGRA